MKHQRRFVLALLSVLLFGSLASASAQTAEKRLALVVGNANYSSGALPTPANDAGLIAQTLQAAGFDVVGVRDLDQDSLRRTFRDFIAKVSSAGPDMVAFVYLSGYGLQLEGENYFVPTDANIARDVNVSSEALRLSDYTRPLAALGIKASIVVLDGARANPFAKSGPPLAGGLALVEPDPGTLIAFNAAPGTVAQNEAGPYSSYAQALAEMMREGGLPVTEVFNRVRLRVNDITKGAQVPWNASKLPAPFYFFERAPDAPPPQVSAEQTSSIRSKPIRDFDARDAYLAALDRDNLQDYENFLVAYPRDPMARRVRAIVAARREAITWRRSRSVDTPAAYWSYLRRYPNGFHANDARRRLAYLAAAFEPPPRFEIISYDVLPPPPEEIIYVERPVLIFDDPDFGFEPPPPPPVFFLPPRPVYFIDLAPPPPPIYEYVLPVPVYVPVPVWVNPPRYIAPPPNNFIYNNIHNTVVINNTTNTVTVTNPAGQTQTISPPAQSPASQPQSPAAGPQPPGAQPPAAGAKSSPGAAGVAAAGIAGAGAAALLAPSLPPSVAPKAVPVQNTTAPNTLAPGSTPPAGTAPPPGKPPVAGQPQPAPSPAAPGQAQKQVVPETKGGQPLPSVDGKPPVAGQPQPSPLPTAPGQGQKQVVPETKGGQPLPGSGGQPLPGTGGQPLPPINGRPPVTGQPAPAPSPTPPGQAQKQAVPESKGGQPLPGTGGQPLPSVNGKPPVTGQPLPAPSQPTQPSAPVQPPKPSLPETKGGQPPSLPAQPKPPGVAPSTSPPPPSAPTPPPAARPTPPPPPPPAARPAPPPPPVARPAPPPPPRPAPPPPPVARPAPPPPPPPVARPAPPPPPPPAARPAPPAGKPCVLPTGQPCPGR